MNLISYTITNKRYFLYTLLLSIIFVSLIFPLLMNVGFLRSYYVNTSIKTSVGITAGILFLTVLSFKKANKLWQRYKNTHMLKNPPFLYLDLILPFIFFSGTLIALFQTKFMPTELSPQFRIFSAIHLVSILLWFLTSYYYSNPKIVSKKPTDIDRFTLSDEPIQFFDQDLLGRATFIENLYEEIISLPFADSFVFGLHGSWGEGKTSVVNLLKNKLENNEDFLIVEFDPWYFKNQEAILVAFYKQIEQVLNQRFIFPDLKRTFARYKKLIISGFSNAGIKIDFSPTEETLEETKERIETCIFQTEKKMIIFIDDIDRLQSEEILLIFKLVRLNAKFKNTIFFLSFDEYYVMNILEEKWSTRGSMRENDVNLIHTRGSHVI